MADKPLSGRRAQAERNDAVILDAAREVFLADPQAAVSTVAARAGVGISALYRRYPSKDELLRALARDGLERFAADLQRALDDDVAGTDGWASYTDCLARVVAGRSQSLAQRIAGTFTPTAELGELATRAGRLYRRLHERTRKAGGLRRDVSPADVVLLLELLGGLELPGADSGAAARQRYLAVLLQGLHASPDAPGLPGRAAREADLAVRWTPPGG